MRARTQVGGDVAELVGGDLPVFGDRLPYDRAVIGALLLAKPVTTEKRRLDIPGIVVVGEARPPYLTTQYRTA